MKRTEDLIAGDVVTHMAQPAQVLAVEVNTPTGTYVTVDTVAYPMRVPQNALWTVLDQTFTD